MNGPVPIGLPRNEAKQRKEKKCPKVPFADDVATGMPAPLVTWGMFSWTRVCHISEATSNGYNVDVKVHRENLHYKSRRKCTYIPLRTALLIAKQEHAAPLKQGGVEAQQNDQAEGQTLADLQVFQIYTLVCLTMPQHTPSHATIARNHHMEPSHVRLSNNFIAMRRFKSFSVLVSSVDLPHILLHISSVSCASGFLFLEALCERSDG